MNKIVNKFSLARNKLMSEMHVRQDLLIVLVDLQLKTKNG